MTIKGQLNRLPIPYRDLALKNANKALFKKKSRFVSDSVFRAFFWLHTPEGEDFWEQVFEWTRYHTDGIRIRPDAPQLPPIPEDV